MLPNFTQIPRLFTLRNHRKRAAALFTNLKPRWPSFVWIYKFETWRSADFSRAPCVPPQLWIVSRSTIDGSLNWIPRTKAIMRQCKLLNLLTGYGSGKSDKSTIVAIAILHVQSGRLRGWRQRNPSADGKGNVQRRNRNYYDDGQLRFSSWTNVVLGWRSPSDAMGQTKALIRNSAEHGSALNTVKRPRQCNLTRHG